MNLAEIAVKYGAMGIVCAWLGVTNLRLSAVENRLLECYDERILEIRSRHSTNFLEPNNKEAILPTEKKRKYEFI